MSTSSLPQRLPERDAFHVYDTTLRDGAQREGISYSVVDKLAVARLLDDYGVGFIEGGWPGALPKDTEFFARAQNELSLTRAQLVAFGATRKAGVAVTEDQQVRALLDSGAPVITLVAKSDVWHVEQALKTSLDENESMIRDTVAFLVGEGRRVFVDTTLTTECACWSPPPSPAPMSASCVTPMAECCRWGLQRSWRRWLLDPAFGWGSTAKTTPPARWPTR